MFWTRKIRLFGCCVLFAALLLALRNSDLAANETNNIDLELISETLDKGLENASAVEISTKVENCRIDIFQKYRNQCLVEHLTKADSKSIWLSEISNIIEVRTESSVMLLFNFTPEVKAHLKVAENRFHQLAVPTEGLSRRETLRFASDEASRILQNVGVRSNSGMFICGENREAFRVPSQSISIFVANEAFSNRFGSEIQKYHKFCKN